MKLFPLLSLVFSVAALAVAVRIANPTPAVPSLTTLRSELADAQRRLSDSESKLLEVLSRLAQLERRYATSAEPSALSLSRTVAKPSLPLLAGGSYTLERDAVVYSDDAKLRFANDEVISSPTGVMVSDLEQKMVVGDLALETATGTLEANAAVVDMNKGMVTAKKFSFTFTPKKVVDGKGPNEAPAPAPTAVTAPAAQEPRRP
ncbi:MAG: hypothetical protein Q7S40_04635 [Opitutaceae bacterium]|nr:hypothetical protein [Opitutaceae bacterium]